MTAIKAHTRVDFLDYLRGLMAVSVLLYHYSFWLGFHYGYPFDQLLSRLGLYAVSAFYVLSGTSLAIVYLDKRVDKDFIKDFSIKRVFRIAPLFYVATILTLLFTSATALKNNDISILPDLKTIILNLTITFGWISPKSYIATGAWSIGNELVFYSIFPIMLILYRKSMKHLTLFFVGTIFITSLMTFLFLNDNALLENQWGRYIHPLNQLYLFTGGCLLGALLKRGLKISKGILITMLSIAVLLFTFLPVNSTTNASLVIGYPKLILSASVFSVVIFATFWGNVKYNYLTVILKFVGDISYSIYLIHPVMYMAVGLGLSFVPIFDSKVIYFIAATILTFAFSTFVYFYIERPFKNLGKRVSINYRNKESKPIKHQSA